MKNYNIEIEINSKDWVRVLIKNIIRAELYISGNDRKDVIQSIVSLTTNE